MAASSINGKVTVFNGVTFFAFLRRLRVASHRPDRRVVVIVDNAKYHHTLLHKDWRSRHAKRFALDFLPPYSPDLNPIERVWKLTRRLCVHNRYFPDLETSSTTSRLHSTAGGEETRLFADYAQLVKTLCLVLSAAGPGVPDCSSDIMSAHVAAIWNFPVSLRAHFCRRTTSRSVGLDRYTTLREGSGEVVP